MIVQRRKSTTIHVSKVREFCQERNTIAYHTIPYGTAFERKTRVIPKKSTTMTPLTLMKSVRACSDSNFSQTAACSPDDDDASEHHMNNPYPVHPSNTPYTFLGSYSLQKNSVADSDPPDPALYKRIAGDADADAYADCDAVDPSPPSSEIQCRGLRNRWIPRLGRRMQSR